MRVVKVRFGSSEEFLAAYDDAATGRTLFCATTTPLAAGAEVICELALPGLPNRVLLRGTVREWRRALPRRRVRAGAVVELAAQEAGKQQFILEVLAGRRTGFQRRRHARVPVEVPVLWRLADATGAASAHLTEISVGGALLHGAETELPIGTEVVLEVTPPGAVGPIPISGRVSYVVPGRGVGIRFAYRNGGGARRLAELVRRLLSG